MMPPEVQAATRNIVDQHGDGRVPKLDTGHWPMLSESAQLAVQRDGIR
jgi:hypothetical protein